MLRKTKTLLLGLSVLAVSAYALPTEQYSESYVKPFPRFVGALRTMDPNDQFGRSVAIDGNYMVVGVPNEDSTWTFPTGPIPATPPFPGAASGTKANSGAAWVYKRQTDNSWQPTMYLKAFNSGVNDNFGGSVAISGDIIVIGARKEDGDADSCTAPTPCVNNNTMVDSGAAYVFIRQPNSETWVQQAFLKADDRAAGNDFGKAVSIDGNTIAVGADEAAYIYTTSGPIWAQQAKITAGNTNVNDLFGNAIAVDGDHVIIGAVGEDGDGNSIADNSLTDSGAAYIYHRTGTTWTQQAYLKAANLDSNDLFGASVAINGNIAVVGATAEAGNGENADNNTAANAGAVYVFELNNNQWKQTAYLKAIDVNNTAAFGASVAVYNDTVVVGSSSANGGSNNSGAAYVYKKTGNQWKHRSYLSADKFGTGDLFGDAIAISKIAPHNIAIGAPGEDSSSIAYPLNPADNSTPSTGAAYVFHSPTTVNLPQASTTYSIAGVLTGLAATDSITLRNKHSGGQEDMAVTGAGVTTSVNFMFTSPIDGMYDVSIPNQPAGYYCEVNSPVGDTQDVGGYGNVRDVYVNCGHSVGGNVSGLVGGGTLMLTNAGETLSINSDGSFAFENMATNGSNYDIKVQSQPTGQNCTVIGGVGSVSANVTNVNVSCLSNAASTYHVGGTINGLADGKTVTMTNGSETKIFAMNGGFNFDVAGTDGSSYAVAVATQPVGQTCTVSNNSGSIAGANVGNVTVDCRTNGVARYNVSGAWYDPAYDGSGFVMMQTPLGLGLSFYSYKGGDNGNTQWLISDFIGGDALEVGRTYNVNMYSGYPGNGGTFSTKPNLPTPTGPGTKYWGKLALRFDDCDKGQATLVDGDTSNGNDGRVTLSLQRLYSVNDINCTGSSSATGFNVSGAWYDSAFNGSGFYLTETTIGLVTTFYGYKATGNGNAFWLVSEPLPASTTISKNTAYNFAMRSGFMGNGGSFARKPTAANTGTKAWGSMNLSFDSCNSATLTLTDNDTSDGDDGSRTYPLVKLVGVNGLTCTE